MICRFFGRIQRGAQCVRRSSVDGRFGQSKRARNEHPMEKRTCVDGPCSQQNCVNRRSLEVCGECAFRARYAFTLAPNMQCKGRLLHCMFCNSLYLPLEEVRQRQSKSLSPIINKNVSVYEIITYLFQKSFAQ